MILSLHHISPTQQAHLFANTMDGQGIVIQYLHSFTEKRAVTLCEHKERQGNDGDDNCKPKLAGLGY